MTPTSYHRQTTSATEIDLAAIALAEQRAQAERHVLECLLAHPQKMLVIATAEGLSQWDFGHPDHRLLYIAVTLAADKGIHAVLRLARSGLRHFNLWDAETPRGSRGMHHSDATLAELASAESPNTIVCRHAIHQLQDIIERQMKARRLLSEVRRLIEGVAA